MSKIGDFFKTLLTSKTVWGTIITQIPVVMASPTPQNIIHSLGIIIAIAGGRSALDTAAGVIATAQGK